MLPVSRVTDENGTAVVQRNEGADVLSYRVVFGNRVGTRDAQLLERRPVDVRQRPDETEPPCRRVIDLGAVGRTIIHSHPVIRAEASDDQNPTVGKGDRGRSEAREGEGAGGRPAAGGGVEQLCGREGGADVRRLNIGEPRPGRCRFRERGRAVRREHGLGSRVATEGRFDVVVASGDQHATVGQGRGGGGRPGRTQEADLRPGLVAGSRVVDVRARVRLISLVEATGHEHATVRKWHGGEVAARLVEALRRLPGAGRGIPQLRPGTVVVWDPNREPPALLADDQYATITEENRMRGGPGDGHRPGRLPGPSDIARRGGRLGGRARGRRRQGLRRQRGGRRGRLTIGRRRRRDRALAPGHEREGRQERRERAQPIRSHASRSSQRTHARAPSPGHVGPVNVRPVMRGAPPAVT